MIRVVKQNMDGIASACRRRHVARRALFGSAAHGRFRKGTSDVDVLVEFEKMPPATYADSYFGLQEDLQQLFNAPVDIVERPAIRNPCFRHNIEQSSVVL